MRCVALIVILLTLAFSPIFASLDKFPKLRRGNDWYRKYRLNRWDRKAVLADHEFTPRSQYHALGHPPFVRADDEQARRNVIAFIDAWKQVR